MPSLVINAGTVNNNILTASNNALGNVTLNGGTLTALNGSATYGAFNLNGTITSTGTSLISTSDTVNGKMMLTSSGPNNVETASIIDVQSGTLTVSAPLAEVTSELKISGLTKNGAGTLTLSGANAYTGATAVTAGTLVAANAAALGTIAAGTTVTSGATLDVRTNTGTEAISIGGAGVGGNGALITSATFTGTVGGAVALTANTTLGGAGTLNIDGAVTGASLYSITKVGTGVTTFGTAPGGSLATVVNLTAQNGTTNVNSVLGGGSSNVSVTGPTTKLRFGSVSQTLSSLTIGAGATVTFTSGAASGAFSGGGKGAGFGGAAAVPEPGTLGLLLVGALGVLNRRRRHA